MAEIQQYCGFFRAMGIYRCTDETLFFWNVGSAGFLSCDTCQARYPDYDEVLPLAMKRSSGNAPQMQEQKPGGYTRVCQP